MERGWTGVAQSGGRTLATSVPAYMASPRPRIGAPNVVMIVLDDLGFGELGSYGSDIETPTIDRLAREGLRYNNFHVTALCAPTRACLITGRNHHAVGMGYLADAPMEFPGYSARIPRTAGTLPRLLKDAGFNTFAVGKWHLTPPSEHGPAGPFDRWPLGLGFERFYGFIKGMTNQWTPDLVRDNGYIDRPAHPDDGYHVTEDFATQAIRLVQDQHHQDPNKPFFLYFATGAMHVPHQVPRSWADRYKNRFDHGWEETREQTFKRQRESGLFPDNTDLTMRPSWVRDWASLTSDQRRVFARQMEVYAGFLSHTDAQVGRVIDYLERIDILDDTLIMVVSDNGADGHGGPNGFFDLSLKNEFGHMLDNVDEFGGFGAFNGYSWGWAWAGNTPFKLWKAYTWLGGVRVPLIIRWPSGSPSIANETRPQFCHAIDLMPTILEAAGVEVPENLDGFMQQRIDGRSLVPTFSDPDAPSPRSTQYFEMGGSRAIYHNGWKATTDHLRSINIAAGMEGSGDFATDRWSLYNLEEDFSEAHDLAESEPARLRELIELWWHEAGRNQVLPLTDELIRTSGTETRSDRLQYELLPGGGPIATPAIVAGFEITATVTLTSNGEASGIVCAQGGIHGGWACYFLNGRLVVVFAFGGSMARIVSDTLIPAGQHDIRIGFSPISEGHGSIRVELAGTVIGETRIVAEITKLAFLSRFAFLLIGSDDGFPLCDDYEPPFTFTDQIDRVILEVPDGIDLRAANAQLAKNALQQD